MIRRGVRVAEVAEGTGLVGDFRSPVVGVIRVVTTLLAVAALAGCGSPSPGAATHEPLSPSATTSASREAGPPGDPGPAPTAPDPGKPTAPPATSSAVTTIPAAALLDSVTLHEVTGGAAWSRRLVTGGQNCATPEPSGATRRRSVAYASGQRRLTETLTTHASGPVAARAVTAAGATLTRCGWTLVPAPPLGTASVQATRAFGAATQTLLVMAADGVAVTLLGSGDITTDQPTWESLADIALGTSCAAEAQGCH